MAECDGRSRIVRRNDGTRVGIWGVFEIRSAFQPIFRFDEGAKLSVYAFECLVRPFRDGTPVSPRNFFDGVPAEDRFEVESLTRDLHLLNASACLDQQVSIFINFDPSKFTRDDSIEETLAGMRRTSARAGLAPDRIVCEFTEQKSLSGPLLRNLIESFRAEGYRIAVDDFGADDSDYNRIVTLKPDIVKFDADWIGRLMRSPSGYRLLKVMVNRISDLGIESVIEGIEEAWQLELSERSGAMMVQGFGLARPQFLRAGEPGPSTYSGTAGDREHGGAPREGGEALDGRTDRQPARVFGRRGRTW